MSSNPDARTPKHAYGLALHWSNLDEKFVAECPAFPEMSALGKTREEALANAEAVLALLIEDYEADGDPLPPPTPAPSYSGQTRLRMPVDLHALLAKQAAAQGVSLNTYIVSLLSAGYAIERTAEEAISVVREVARQEYKAVPSR
ncbi:MAG: type II toxin-antitoxin system HicB family antitoxin [Bacteroidota bacterium]